MIGVTTVLLYVESEDDADTFAWYGGKVLKAAQHAERAQLHRELTDIVEHAESDETADWGRAARNGDRLLVEVEVSQQHGQIAAGVQPTAGISVPGARHPLTATIVLSVAGPDTKWVHEAATEIAVLLREQDFDIAVDQLAQAFAEGWSRESPPRERWAKRGLATAGTALMLALWWILGRSWMRRRHRHAVALGSGTSARVKMPRSKEHR
jgi:hypothetical protein